MKVRSFGFLAVALLGVAALTGCGEQKSSSVAASSVSSTASSVASSVASSSVVSSSAASSSVAVTLKYQYTGEDTSMASYGFAYSFYLNVYSDGNLDGYGYSMYSMNTTDAATNTNFYKWFTGKWGAAKDDDGENCLRLVVNYADGVKSSTGDVLTNKSNYTVYENADKTLTDINSFNIPIGLSGRTTKLTYNKTPYADSNSFIKGTAYKFTAPTSYLAVFDDAGTFDRIYCFAEGKGSMYGSAVDPADETRKYYPKQDITWTYTSSTLSLVIASTAHAAVLDGNKATVAWEEAVYGDYKIQHNLVCEDASKLMTTDVGGDTGTTYPAGTVYFTYAYMPSYNLSISFSAAYAVWSTGVGTVTAAYTNVAGDTSELFAFTPDTDHSAAVFSLKKDGSFAFSYTLAGNAISKVGTFTYGGKYSFVLTTTDGSVAEVTTSIAH